MNIKKCGWCDSEDVLIRDDVWLECKTCGYFTATHKYQPALEFWKKNMKYNPDVKKHVKFNARK